MRKTAAVRWAGHDFCTAGALWLSWWWYQIYFEHLPTDTRAEFCETYSLHSMSMELFNLFGNLFYVWIFLIKCRQLLVIFEFQMAIGFWA